MLPSDGAAGDPRQLVSRPLFLGRDGKPLPELERWEMPTIEVDGITSEEFKKFVARRPLVVLGGLQLIIELGLMPLWYNDETTRKQTASLIKKRGWDEILQELAGKEHNPDDLFGKNSINEFFSTCPPIRRSDEDAKARRPKKAGNLAQGNIFVRRTHPLRIRKAIEFITMTEVILRDRFSVNRTHQRFSNLTGLAREDAYPEVVWDFLWLEPVNYCVSLVTSDDHVAHIMRRTELVSRFTKQSGQAAGALYFIIKGAPGKFETVQAACEVLNVAYPKFPKTFPMTVPPNVFKERFDLFSRVGVFKDRILEEYHEGVEYIPVLGPDRLSPIT